jgi:hypothetical protein
MPKPVRLQELLLTVRQRIDFNGRPIFLELVEHTKPLWLVMPASGLRTSSAAPWHQASFPLRLWAWLFATV